MCCLPWLGLVSAPLSAQARNMPQGVLGQVGNMPLLMTVANDGGESLAGVAPRIGGSLGRDLGTRLMAEKIAQLLEQKYQVRPYLLLATIHPKYLDVNRPQAEALESPLALPAYQAYHKQLTQYLASLRKQFPQGALLIDLHGQNTQPDTVFRSTRNGQTLQHLRSKYGDGVWNGADSLCGMLEHRGYRVFPSFRQPAQAEYPRFLGGHLITTYGSQRPGGIDAVQLNLGKNLRFRNQTAQDLAEVIWAFTQQYLSPRQK